MLSRQRLVADKQCRTVPTWSQKFEERFLSIPSSFPEAKRFLSQLFFV